MLKSDIAARIRAIYQHDGSPVTVVDFIILLGWEISTFDDAVARRLITILDAGSAAPRISHAQLLERAREQWSEAEIVEALGGEGPRILAGTQAPAAAASVIRDAVRAEPVALQVVPALTPDEMLAAGLRPPHREPLPRRRSRPRVPAVALPPPLPPTRRNRADGVREATMISACAGDNGSAPHLRLRGHWLSRFGFKVGARIYIVAERGKLTITTTDPAAARGRQPSAPPVAVQAGAKVG